MKDYISITRDNAERILSLRNPECAVFIFLALSADEEGRTSARTALKNLTWARTSINKAIEALEEKGMIRRRGNTIFIENWEEYQL